MTKYYLGSEKEIKGLHYSASADLYVSQSTTDRSDLSDFAAINCDLVRAWCDGTLNAYAFDAAGSYPIEDIKLEGSILADGLNRCPV